MSGQLNLDDAEKIKTLIVDPMIQALKTELEARVSPLVEVKANHEARIASLESNQKRALIGWGVASLGVSAILTSAWQWLQSKIRIG